MKRTVQRQFLDNWLSDHYPNAVAKLSIKSGVTSNSISKVRLGRIPKNAEVRKQLCKAIGIKEDDLFPPIES
jgi:hypothetical protein